MNQINSKIPPSTELKMLRVSLLFCDQVINAGFTAIIFSCVILLDQLKDEYKFNFLKDIYSKICHPNDRDVYDDFVKLLEVYDKFNAIKYKSKDMLLYQMKLRKGLTQYTDVIKIKLLEKAKDWDLSNLKVFEQTEVIKLETFAYSSNDPLQLRRILNFISELLMNKECFILLDKNSFEINLSDNINTNESKGHSVDLTEHFFYDELCTMPSVENINFDHLTVLRNSFLTCSKDIRDHFTRIAKDLSGIMYNTASMEIFDGCYNELKKLNQFDKIIGGNVLLNELREMNKERNRIRLSYAITSYKNLLSILEKMLIINERENLFLQGEIVKKTDLNNCIPFLIYEEVG